MVPGAGVEPARALAHNILSVARLPISPPRHTVCRTVSVTKICALANYAFFLLFMLIPLAYQKCTGGGGIL